MASTSASSEPSSWARPTPWDALILGCPTFELCDADPVTLQRACQQPGHYTVRVAPLACTQALHSHGFYYCDTLIEPYCRPDWLLEHPHPEVGLLPQPPLSELLAIAHGAFVHGRFHRDPAINRAHAEARYAQWLEQLHAGGKVWGLTWRQDLLAFIAVEGNQLVLHATASHARGQGKAKYLWSPLCRLLFERGHTEVRSSISASNLAVLNLYASLGFKFRHAKDIYHRLSP